MTGREQRCRYPSKDGMEGCYAAGFDRCQDVQTVERMDGSWESRCFACGAFYGMGCMPATANEAWRCPTHPALTPGERFPSDGGGPYCLACAEGREQSPWLTSDEPCPSGHTDCTVDCGSCKGTGRRVVGRAASARK